MTNAPVSSYARTASLPLVLLLAGLLTACGGSDQPAGPAAACATPTGAGVTHQGVIEADQVWTAADSPHVLTFGVQVKQGTLTIEPCAVVRIQEGFGIVVGGTAGAPAAALVARGEAVKNSDGSTTVRGVTFMPDTPGTHWGSIRIFPTGRLDLERVTLTGGGEHATAQNIGGTLVVSGAGGPGLTRSLRTVSVTVADSEGLGVNLQNHAAFTEDSTELTIRGSGQTPSISNLKTDYPLLISPPALKSIPIGSYTGNKLDAIEVLNASGIEVDETFPNRGVPYHLGGSFSIAPKATMKDGGLLTLTIEAGVTIKLDAAPASQARSFNLGVSNGELPENLWPVKLVAAGTPDKPITFTSAATSPAAGDWGGIEWRAGPATGNVMTQVRIEYAGSDSGTVGFGCGPGDNDAALIITNWRPESAFIQGLTVLSSAAGGIVSGWRTDAGGPNLKDGNTFTGVANGCSVSRWANLSSPVCPGNDSIPDCL